MNVCIWVLKPPDVDGTKFLIKMTRPQNIKKKEQCFVPDQNFDFIRIRRPCTP